MYGLSYCKLDYETMLEMDIELLGIYIKAEIDREVHEYDITMKNLAWQTSHLMNATGNFKSPVKPNKLYKSIVEDEQNSKPKKNVDIKAEREELLKTFGLKE